MTWIKFALWLSAFYAFYYGALFLWDYLRAGKTLKVDGPHALTFVEHSDPVLAVSEPATEYYPTAVVSSGGVSLKQLFNMARDEAVVYTKAVSY